MLGNVTHILSQHFLNKSLIYNTPLTPSIAPGLFTGKITDEKDGPPSTEFRADKESIGKLA